MRGSHESSRGLLQAASARDGAQAKRCDVRPLLATFGIDALVHTGVGGARANNNGSVGSGLPDAVRRLTALPSPGPRPPFVPSLGEGCVWATMKQLAWCLGVIAPAANACFACHVVCTGEMTLPAASYALIRCCSEWTSRRCSTTEQCLLACTAALSSCPVGGHSAVGTHARICIHRYCTYITSTLQLRRNDPLIPAMRALSFRSWASRQPIGTTANDSTMEPRYFPLASANPPAAYLSAVCTKMICEDRVHPEHTTDSLPTPRTLSWAPTRLTAA